MQPDTRMIFNDPFFREAWSMDVAIPEIAALYGTSRAAIYRAAKRFGLGPRNPVMVVEIEPEPRPTGYVEQLVWSAGRWAILQELATDYGKTSTQVQADFHRARMDAK